MATYVNMAALLCIVAGALLLTPLCECRLPRAAYSYECLQRCTGYSNVPQPITDQLYYVSWDVYHQNYEDACDRIVYLMDFTKSYDIPEVERISTQIQTCVNDLAHDKSSACNKVWGIQFYVWDVFYLTRQVYFENQATQKDACMVKIQDIGRQINQV